MTPKQFNKLREGDLIRNKNGHGFFVIRNSGYGSLVAQCILDVPVFAAGDWTHAAELVPVSHKPKIEDFPPAPKRPSFGKMHEDLIAAGFTLIEDRRGRRWRSSDNIFTSKIETAWDSLPKASRPEVKTVQLMRYELRKVGWTMDSESGAVAWTSPTGLVKRIWGTRAAWNYVFGDGAP